MRAYNTKYKQSGKTYNDSKKEEFYEFVGRSRLRRKK